MMKLFFLSDIHGVVTRLKKALAQMETLQADRIILLGDALYHGPRNGVPDFYDGAATAELLNRYADKITAVRGNCDAEIDQMMLHFPMMADFSQIILPEAEFFLTHGHLFNADHLPPVTPGTILAQGHTHIAQISKLDNGITIFNPGSISLPKGGNPPSFGFFDGRELSVRELDSGLVFMSSPVVR